MLSWRKRKSSDPKAPGKGRSWAYWLGRLALVGIVAGSIVLGLVWWTDRPLAQAEEALSKGDPKYAHYLLTKFLAGHPAHPRATALQGQVEVLLGNPYRAIELFEQAGGSTVEDHRAWARALLMTEQWTLALPLLERIARDEPTNADALYELTACRVRLGLFEQALASARQFASLPGQEARGQMFLGVIMRDLGKDAEAVAAFENVLKHDPKAESLQTPAAEFYLQYGQTLLRLGKAEQSLDPLKRSVAARETPDALFELGNAALQLQRPADAQSAWKRAVVVNEQHAGAREALARAALGEGQAQQALDWLSPLADATATLESAYLRQRAYKLLGREQEAQAWQAVAASLRKKQELNAEIDHLMLDSPDSFWARAVRAHRFAEQGNWRQAELLVEILRREAPGEPFVIELTTAVHRRRDLPPLESLPITHF